MSDTNNEPDIANWTAERMRKMHVPIRDGKFMEGGLTPHQYMTKEIEKLLAHQQAISELKGRIDELNKGKPFFLEQTGDNFYWRERMEELKAQLKQLEGKK